MIELFIPNNTNFNKTGNTILQPITCEVTAEINGTWSLSMLHPIDQEERWKGIETSAVLRVPSFNGSQLFRITQTEKTDEGILAMASPIFMDAAGDNILIDTRPTNMTGQQALAQILKNNNKYSGSSNITKTSTAYYILKNAMEAIAGDDENSFLNRWGGEILFDNFRIIINTRIGGDYGAALLYGKNVQRDGFTENVNIDGVITRIIPQAFNGRRIAGNSPWVDSPNITAYPTVHTRVIEYPDIRLAADVTGDTTGITVCQNQAQLETALRKAANEEFTAGADKPQVSIDANMVLLANTEDYEDLKSLERVSLGDTVHCTHSRLGITTDARVTGIIWNCITEAPQEVTIGATPDTVMTRLTTAVKATERALTPAGNVVAEQIEGFINGALAQLRLQSTIAEKQDVRAVLFEDLDPSSPTYGAMALGTQGFQISNTRTADGQDWEWSTFGTAEGFNADLITAGTLAAINILGVNISGSDITGSTITGTNITGGTIKSGGSGSGGVIQSYYPNDYLGLEINSGRIYIYSPNESGVSGGYFTGYGSGSTAGLRINGNNGGGVRLGVTNQEYFRIDDNGKAVYILGPSDTAGQNIAYLTAQNKILTLAGPSGIRIANTLQVWNGSAYVNGYTGTKGGITFRNGIAIG